MDPLLNIKQKHELFTEKCEMREVGFENVKPVHFQVYRQTFCDKYNLSFFKPKKDKCSACKAYKNLKELGTGKENEDGGKMKQQELDENYQAQIRRKTEMRTLKSEAKKRSMLDNMFHFVTFDLQAILQLPCADSSPMYYKCKIVVYNLTFYNGSNGCGTCYVCTEMEGKMHYILIQWIQCLLVQLSVVTVVWNCWFCDTFWGMEIPSSLTT